MKKTILALIVIMMVIPVSSASIVEDVSDLFGLFVNPEDYDVTTHDFGSVKSWSYQTDEDVIFETVHKVSPGTTINETYYYGDNEIDVNFRYTHDLLTTTYYFELDNGTSTVSGSYNKYTIWPGDKEMKVVYSMDNKTLTGLSAIVPDGIQKLGLKMEDKTLETIPVTKVTGTSNDYIDFKVNTVTYAGFEESRSETEELVSGKSSFKWLNTALTIWDAVSFIFWSMFWFINTFFVQHWILIFIWFEGLALMYSLNAKTIDGWFWRMIKFHEGFILAILKIVDFTISIFYKIGSIVLKIIKPV